MYHVSCNLQARIGNACNFSAAGRMKAQNVTTPKTTQRMLTM